MATEIIEGRRADRRRPPRGDDLQRRLSETFALGDRLSTVLEGCSVFLMVDDRSSSNTVNNSLRSAELTEPPRKVSQAINSWLSIDISLDILAQDIMKANIYPSIVRS